MTTTHLTTYEQHLTRRKNRNSNFLIGILLTAALLLTGTFYASKNGATDQNLIPISRGTRVVSNQYHE